MLQKFLDTLAEKIAEKVADKVDARLATAEQDITNLVEGFVTKLEQELAGIPIIGGVFKGQSS
ncbi:hypothetical protein [Mycobacterium sp. E1747]|uniref:hypothetical protein n=1 Tax=Mycobacterium sp. E1747 TaxID=1834128 RepID=UPI000801F7D9|nr:hypothetical protein [Mycobacterium sp. E1747]OBH02424.1 hypothetical protein A5695_11840 [Mycobacterium sp. E1747]